VVSSRHRAPSTHRSVVIAVAILVTGVLTLAYWMTRG
jgi:hypothetical protein